jgi:hypothetical protein
MNNPRVDLTRFLFEDLKGIQATLYVTDGILIRLLDVNGERLAFRADFGRSPDARKLGRLLTDILVRRYGDAVQPTRLGVAVGEPGMVCPGARPAWPAITYAAYAERIPAAGSIELEQRFVERFDTPDEEARDHVRELWAAGVADGWSDPEGPDGMWFASRAFSEDRGFDWLLRTIEQRIAEREAKERKEKGGLRWSLRARS